MQQGNKILRSIKFSPSTDEVIEEMRGTHSPSKSYNNMVETLVENNPDFIVYSKKRKKKNKQ